MEEVKEDYNKYKKYIINGSIILLGIFMLFYILIPQTLAIFDKREKIEQAKVNLKKLSDVKEAVDEVSDDRLEKDLSIAGSAYPSLGNIIDIYLAIMYAASKADVSVSGFNVTLGPVYYKRENDQIVREKGNEAGILLHVEVKTENSGIRNGMKYAQELYKIIPLAQVQSVNGKQDAASLEMVIYRKAYDMKNLADISKIVPVTSRQEVLLNKIREWKDAQDNLSGLGIRKRESTQSSALETSQ